MTDAMDTPQDAETARKAGDHRTAGEIYRKYGMIACAELEEETADFEAIESPPLSEIEPGGAG